MSIGAYSLPAYCFFSSYMWEVRLCRRFQLAFVTLAFFLRLIQGGFLVASSRASLFVFLCPFADVLYVVLTSMRFISLCVALPSILLADRAHVVRHFDAEVLRKQLGKSHGSFIWNYLWYDCWNRLHGYLYITIYNMIVGTHCYRISIYSPYPSIENQCVVSWVWNLTHCPDLSNSSVRQPTNPWRILPVWLGGSFLLFYVVFHFSGFFLGLLFCFIVVVFSVLFLTIFSLLRIGCVMWLLYQCSVGTIVTDT